MSRVGLKTWETMAAEEGSIPLGNGVFYTKSIDKDGNWIGIDEWHKDPQGELCGGWAPFDVDSPYILPTTPKWQVVSLEPLHMEPSLLCGCGHHGFIRNGQWESC